MSINKETFPKAGAALVTDITAMIESIKAVKGPLWCSAVLQTFNMVNCYHMAMHVQCGEVSESLKDSVNNLTITNIEEFMSFAIAVLYPEQKESATFHRAKMDELLADMNMLHKKQTEYNKRTPK